MSALSALPLVLGAACSDLAGPAATLVPAPSISASYLDVEEPQSLGSPQVVPANAGLGVPDWEQASNIGPLPDSAWIVVEVRGTVLHTKHPWCDQLYSASGGCNYPLDGVRLGPLERHGGSGVIVSLLPPGVVPHPYFSNGDHMYAPDGNMHGDVARMVVRNTTGPKVVWFRRLDATPKPGNATTGLYGPMYYMSSDQKVSARVIPPPLRVDAPAVVREGAVATFSVSPTADFKFRMPDWRPHFVYWRYFPGDTAARPNPFGPRQDVPCDSTVCSWAPPKSGRMWAFTYVDGFGVDAKSQIVRVDSAQLEMTCDRYKVDRGQSVNCSAAAKPSGTLDSIRWEFTDTTGRTIAGPEGAASWGGQMVTGGRIRVSARLNGLPVAKDTAVRVDARRWSTIRLRVRQHSYPPGHLPSPANVQLPGHLGDSHADTLVALSVYQIPDGPNAGWWYIDQPVTEFGWVVHINEAAFAAGSAWYNLQTGGNYVLPSGVVVPNGRCSSFHIPTMRQKTREHEGLGSSGLTSHADAARVYLNTQKPQDTLEQHIAYGPDLFGYNFYQSAYATFVGVASAMEGFAAPHTNESPPGIVDLAPFPCYARPWWP